MAELKAGKRTLIDKANRSSFIAIVTAATLLVFTLVSLNSLSKVYNHRVKVIKAKKLASTTLSTNDLEIGKLITSYIEFENTSDSVMGTSEKNSKVVLDALPPKYDFPALATSLEKILTDGGYTITSITGIDNEVSEVDEDTADPQPVEIPFTISVTGPYDKVKNLAFDLERSIRPVHVITVDVSGSANEAIVMLTAKTYYQPGKNLDVSYKEIR